MDQRDVHSAVQWAMLSCGPWDSVVSTPMGLFVAGGTGRTPAGRRPPPRPGARARADDELRADLREYLRLARVAWWAFSDYEDSPESRADEALRAAAYSAKAARTEAATKVMLASLARGWSGPEAVLDNLYEPGAAPGEGPVLGRVKLHDLPDFSVGNTIQLVGAVYEGEGRTLLVPIPEYRQDGCWDSRPLELLELDAAAWEEFLRLTDHQEVEVSNGAAKAVLRKTQRLIAAQVSWNVFRRDGYACCYCGRDDVPLTVDHLVLWEEGGPSTEANLLTACKRCNKARGNLAYRQWLDSPTYSQLSRGITADRHMANLKLVPTLDALPRLDRLRSRR